MTATGSIAIMKYPSSKSFDRFILEPELFSALLDGSLLPFL
jgi:hypothetical protein